MASDDSRIEHCDEALPGRERPVIHIGGVPIYGDTALAPMMGFSDVPFRTICRRFGAAMTYTPLVLDVALLHRRRAKLPPLIEFVDEERPVAVQLLSNDPETLVAAGQKVQDMGADMIDINLGCPSRKVNLGGRGAAMLLKPDAVGELASALVGAVTIPVMAKIRLGWDADSRNHCLIARVLEESGVAAIGVHGRTRAQAYSGEADWDAIAEVRGTVSIPVLANGDVRDAPDVARIKAHTGCEFALIGRGAIGNPWIFAGRSLVDVEYSERLDVIRDHVRAMVATYGERQGITHFRKHLVKYTRGLTGAAAMRPLMMQAATEDALMDMMEGWSPSVSVA